MTEKEAIEALRLEDGIEFYGKPRRIADFCNALDGAIRALEEIQQYQAIGSVEECQEAVEKQKPKKPILDVIYHQQYYCPNCELVIYQKFDKKDKKLDVCKWCGQAIDWSAEEKQETHARTCEGCFGAAGNDCEKCKEG